MSTSFDQRAQFQEELQLDACSDIIVIVDDMNIHLSDSIDICAKRLRSLLNAHYFVHCVSGPNHRACHTLDIVIIRDVIQRDQLTC